MRFHFSVLLEFCDAENRDELVAMEKEIEDEQFKEEEENSGGEEDGENPDDINLSEGSSGEDEGQIKMILDYGIFLQILLVFLINRESLL